MAAPVLVAWLVRARAMDRALDLVISLYTSRICEDGAVDPSLVARATLALRRPGPVKP